MKISMVVTGPSALGLAVDIQARSAVIALTNNQKVSPLEGDHTRVG